MLYSCEKSILRKKLVFPFEKFPSLVLSRNAIMLQHLIIQFLFKKKWLRLLTRGFKYSDLPWKILVFWKTGR